jgi:anti-sigma B factor antagonist
VSAQSISRPHTSGSSTPAESPEPFRCDVVEEPGRVRVAPVGELDLVTAEPLVQTIREVRRSGVKHLILDLRGVSFIDASGVRLAFHLHTEAADDGLRLELVPGPPNVQRIFELTGAHEWLPFVPPEPQTG